MRYMHNLFVAEISADNLFDEFGNFIPVTPVLKPVAKCRFESSGAGTKVSNQDGAQMVAAGIVYTENSTPFIETGSYMEVKDDSGQKLISGTVLRFSRNRHNCRIWV